MSLLFQSNPDQWDLRKHFEPQKYVSWHVSRYENLMWPGKLVLLWVAKGHEPPQVRGLYGWGITTGEVRPDSHNELRIRLQYIERWVAKSDHDADTPPAQHRAPIPASKILSLPSWKKHPLATIPAGTNFLVSEQQMRELLKVVGAHGLALQFQQAYEQSLSGSPLPLGSFEPGHVVAKE